MSGPLPRYDYLNRESVQRARGRYVNAAENVNRLLNRGAPRDKVKAAERERERLAKLWREAAAAAREEQEQSAQTLEYPSSAFALPSASSSGRDPLPNIGADGEPLF